MTRREIPRREIELVGFDADDTLWHSEDAFHAAESYVAHALGAFADEATVRAELLATERQNLALYGYGAKAFTLSIVETALRVSDATIAPAMIRELIDHGKALLSRPIELLAGAAEVVASVAGRYPIVLITKGDLAHQERKVAASGLAAHFRDVHVVSEKDPASYRKILSGHSIQPSRFVMVGNSVRSDLLPIIELGGVGVHIPYHVTWAHEVADPGDHPRNEAGAAYWELGDITQLPDLLDRLNG